MAALPNLWAVVPIKETAAAKQRLAGYLPAALREQLVLTMMEDVLGTLTASRGLAGIVVVTLDPAATEIAKRFGATIWTDGARDGHTGSVTAAARRLHQNGQAMLTIPGDVPLVRPDDVEAVIARHNVGPGFTIVPSHDKRGSNTVAMLPADCVPLRFGSDSFYPHLDAAKGCGLNPNIVLCPNIALDIDDPSDLAALLKAPPTTHTHELLKHNGFASRDDLQGKQAV